MPEFHQNTAAGEIDPPLQFLTVGVSRTSLTPVAPPQVFLESTRGAQESGASLQRPVRVRSIDPRRQTSPPTPLHVTPARSEPSVSISVSP